MDRFEEVGAPGVLFARIHPLMAMEESTLLLDVDQRDEYGRLFQLRQDRFRRSALNRITFELVDECCGDPVFDFLAEAQ